MKGDRIYGCDPTHDGSPEALVEAVDNGDGSITVTNAVFIYDDPVSSLPDTPEMRERRRLWWEKFQVRRYDP